MLSLELAAVREGLQARILVEMMSQVVRNELVLKGGLAMRAVHGSARFTKDIDLDADAEHPRARIHGIVRRSIDKALTFGLIENFEVTEPKQTDTTMRWKVTGTQPGTKAPLNLTVEVSRRAAATEGHVVELPLSESFAGGQFPGAKVQSLDSQALAVTKVLCLTNINRVAPRDIYDLFVLIEAQVATPAALLAALPDAHTKIGEALKELWGKIEAMDYEQFRSEVIPYLPPAVGALIDEAAFADMGIKVGITVETWLKEAQAILDEGDGGAAPPPAVAMVEEVEDSPPVEAVARPRKRP